LPAPLVDEVEPVVVAVDADPDVTVAVPVPVAVFVAALTVDVFAAVDVPPMGAVDWPLISACSVELNVPVIPVKVNMAEKASAKY